MGSLQAIAQVANNSADCNFAQLVLHEDSGTIVPTFNWTDFFATKMKKIPGIKKLHHFQLDSSSPGKVKVFVREQCDTSETELELLKEPWEPDVDKLPTIVPPHRLSAERRWYLYEQIRPFCPEDDKDSMCPLPSVPRPGGSRRGTPFPEDSGEAADPPTPKHPRLCGHCHLPGHDKRTCPNK